MGLNRPAILCIVSNFFMFASDACPLSAVCRPTVQKNYEGGIQPVSIGKKKLLLFGGRNNKVYLGCLNCDKYTSDSILNKYGDHGGKYSSDSIWNKYGDFGSRYSDHSPWNRYAQNPPMVVDSDGNYFGTFTVNRYHGSRTRVEILVKFLDA